jgi:hypothetical protein
MRKTKRKLMLFFLFQNFISLQGLAYKSVEGNVTALLGPFFYKTNFNTSSSGANSPFLGDPGIILNGDINSNGSLEVAIFHLNKVYVRKQESQYLVEQTELLQISMGYRRWLSSTWSVSLGLFSAYSMGDPTIVHNDFSTGTDIQTSAFETTTYGIDLSIQKELWIRDNNSLVIDARYSWAFAKRGHEYGDHYGLLLGIKHLVQEKQTSD